MPPESPLPGWSRGEVCRLITATLAGSHEDRERSGNVLMAEPNGRGWIPSERENPPRGAGVPVPLDPVSGQPTFFAAAFVAFVVASAVLRRLVAAALTWERAALAWSMARRVWADRRTVVASLSPRRARSR